MSVVMKALTAKAAEEASAASRVKNPSSQLPSKPEYHNTYVSPSEGPSAGQLRWTPLATMLTTALLVIFIGVVGLFVYRSGFLSFFSSEHSLLGSLGSSFKNRTEGSRVGFSSSSIQVTSQEARALFDSGQYDQSLPLFQKLVQEQPSNALLQNDLGMVFLKKELYSSAQVHLTRALELDPSCEVCYGNLGYLKTLLQQYAEAETYLRKAIQLKPDEPKHYFNLAVLYEKNGDLGNGAHYYRQFLDLLPNKDSDIARKVQARIDMLTGR